MLDIRMNPQLQWEEHVKKVADKMKIQTNTLARIIVLIWGVTLATARQIYSVVVRLAMAYGTAI